MKRWIAILGAAMALTISAPLAAQSTDTVLTPRTFIDVSKQVLPAVVSIEVYVPPAPELYQQGQAQSFEDMLREYMQDPNSPSAQDFWRNFRMEDFPSGGAGSGVIFAQKDGWAYLITNAHVLSANDRVEYTVRLDSSLGDDGPIEVSGENVEAVGNDPLTDVAVMKFHIPDGVHLPTVKFANSNDVEVGEWVLALGNPLELNNSVSQGIISAKHRVIEKAPIEDLLQTTAVINPGNSGGPLVNLDGHIVGINNAIATSTGRWAGVGFAIPSNQAQRIAEMLMDKGRVSRGYLGIEMNDLNKAVAEAYDLESDDGVLVAAVVPGTPAAEAGLEAGDLIIRIDGDRIADRREMLQVIASYDAGDDVSVEVLRFRGNERQEKKLKVTLAERPSEDELATARGDLGGMFNHPQIIQEDSPVEKLGLEVEHFNEGGIEGMMINAVESDSNAARAGLRVGDILLQINGIDVTSEEQLVEGLENVRKGKNHVVLFRRAGSNQFITVDPVE
ncbi:PDZ domain-containing protein [bacterium]|nr:PDZ domain-containing protein [bacterium]